MVCAGWPLIVLRLGGSAQGLFLLAHLSDRVAGSFFLESRQRAPPSVSSQPAGRVRSIPKRLPWRPGVRAYVRVSRRSPGALTAPIGLEHPPASGYARAERAEAVAVEHRVASGQASGAGTRRGLVVGFEPEVEAIVIGLAGHARPSWGCCRCSGRSASWRSGDGVQKLGPAAGRCRRGSARRGEVRTRAGNAKRGADSLPEPGARHGRHPITRSNRPSWPGPDTLHDASPGTALPTFPVADALTPPGNQPSESTRRLPAEPVLVAVSLRHCRS